MSEGERHTGMARISVSRGVWFRVSWMSRPATNIGFARTFTHDSEGAPISASIPMRGDLADPAASPPLPFLNWPMSEKNPLIILHLQQALAEAPAPDRFSVSIFYQSMLR